MKRMIFMAIGLVLSGPMIALDNAAVVEKLFQARLQQQLAPVITDDSQAILDESAYLWQTQVNKRLLSGGAPAGFKAGLTTKSAQQKFKVDSAVAGVLLQAPLLAVDQPVLMLSDYHRMMIEMELGYTFKKRIEHPVTITELKSLVATVMPAIELPDLAFDKPAKLQGVDIIANNVIAKRFIVGNQMAVTQATVNQYSTRLFYQDQLVLSAHSAEVMKDQWQALLWLVNRTVSNGWIIEPGQVLITGAIGNMVPAAKGEYRADFSNLGQIVFTVQD